MSDLVPVIGVVGLDGTKPSLRALDAAHRLLKGRDGRIEVVFVAHLGGTASLSAPAMVEVEQGMVQLEQELRATVSDKLAWDHPWRFQRRNGAVATELQAAADEIAQEAPDAEVILVVGAAGQRYHHVVGGVPNALVRHAHRPVLVVP